MGYTPSDMMRDYVEETTKLYDPITKIWDWEDDDGEPLDDYQLEELSYVPSQKAKEIDDNVNDPLNYAYVFDSGKWFESVEEAYLFQEKTRLLKKLMREAFQAGDRLAHAQFEDFWKDYTHG